MSLCSRFIKKVHNFFHPQLGEILMLHRVVTDRSRLAANRQIEVTPDFMEQKILEFKEKGYDFVSIDEVLSRLNQSLVRQYINTYIHKKRFVCITLDDGYQDNYEVAYPIFKKHNVPFCINITTDFYEGKALLWWYMLERLNVSEMAFVRYREEVFSLQNNKEVREKFQEWFPTRDCDWESLVSELSLRPREIITLSSDPLCTIGSHTVSHPNLSIMSPEDQRIEIEVAKKKLESLIQKPIAHFAFPYGYYSDDTLMILENCGVRSALKTWGGSVRVGSRGLGLPRKELVQFDIY